MNKEMPHELQDMIYANCAAVLLGALREKLASFTSSSLYRQYSLPIINIKAEQGGKIDNKTAQNEKLKKKTATSMSSHQKIKSSKSNIS